MRIQAGELVLVTGGSRSGKSAWAEELAAEAVGDHPEQVIYVATAGVHDDEMRRRVTIHQQRRPSIWKTVEESTQLDKVLREWGRKGNVLLIDCLTLWTTNMLLPLYELGEWNTEKEQLIVEQARQVSQMARESEATVIAVGNEVGWGIVPLDPLSRIFRDVAGWVQQEVARQAHRVYLTVSGCPMQIKGPDPNGSRQGGGL
ncbi:bifunctional adenosylcobinamide kinase/adenosylcobinamide-phosphate guanylyltransferase [Heliobacterium chlorum]|uniref:Adenosylcobinamide kinase n=1 Tax=Heliobacterium chlorum TaxID=2698 RepID=A0ABR7T743_HELCL|nr:bifunctional adenosylcobinamide kinase/adenosylcobinamide-phosphate guanylyltransferase [Heliobacterium chlorum]MBC9785785.1 bifunctional adenosylcobinamide kinase/adenosylcobinamide-phosphate guanylyltransferase [Heliobacterium chlorum]